MPPKIIATIWKKPFNEQRVEEIITAGADMLRIKCSHDSPEDIVETFRLAKKLITKLGTSTMLLADLPEAKIRLGDIEAPKESVEAGRTYTLKTADTSTSIETFIPVMHPRIAQGAKAGDRVIIGDGIAFFTVTRVISDEEMLIEAVNTASIVRRSSVTLPETVAAEHLTPLTWEMVAQLKTIAPEYLAFSFINGAETVRNIKKKLPDFTGNAWHPKVIAKIESAEGVSQAGSIAKEADALMIARGDLALMTPIHKLAHIQHDLCRIAQEAGIPSIVATAILDSMETTLFPSRADIGDLSNIIRDNPDWIMLCRATAHSAHPGEIIGMAKKVILETQKEL